MSPYEILGVAPDASVDEIRTSYLRLARIEHPDLHTESAESIARAESRMRAVNEAWATLSDPDERAAIDRQRIVEHNTETAWRPFHTTEVEPGFDERHDAPITHSGLPSWLAIAPVMSLLYGLAAMSLGSFVGITLLALSGVVALVMSILLFITAPLVALGRSQRQDRLR